MPDYVAAIDQGTTSTRCILFDRQGRPAALAQREHEQICPRPGWVEHDAVEIWQSTQRVAREALDAAGADAARIAAVGVTNQRETVIIWDPRNGEPLCNAIVWQDTRTAPLCADLASHFGAGRFRERTGLPVSTYFSGPKIRWALDNTPGLREKAERGEAVAGTVDAWLIWNLTGGPRGGAFVTDVTNASRTLLMGLRSLGWEDDLLGAMHVPRAMLPRIAPSIPAEPWGHTTVDGPFGGRVPVCAALGDQQAALFGQCCFDEGDLKNTCGTGCFMLMNTGDRPVASAHGLLTTVAMQREGEAPVYALEGAIAIAGALVQWLRDNLGVIASAAEVEALARGVDDNGGVYFVPAFSGLFAPHWRPDARGVIAGLTRYATSAHIARAALESTCFQTLDVLDAMRRDAGVKPERLRVDGGMTANDLLMQTQADILGMPVVRPAVAETTALGAAFAAGLAAGFYESRDALRAHWRADRQWTPAMDAAEHDRLLTGWRKALDRSLGWEA